MAIAGDAQLINLIVIHFDQYDHDVTFINMMWQSKHDYVANAWRPSGSCHGYTTVVDVWQHLQMIALFPGPAQASVACSTEK